MIIPIILSGGAGTRLWPLSWGDHPKQFLPLVSERTMIQETLLRLEGLEIGNPIISCGEGHRFLVAQQIGEITNKKPVILLEPMAKNTAPAIAAACCAAMKQDKDAVVVVLPSDHVIADVKSMIENGRWTDLIREVPVHKGDFFFIEPGTVHAIKGGTVILETQQSSDITYRVYDYDRLQDGTPRQLHVKQSIDVINAPYLQKSPPLNESKSIGPLKTACKL